MRTAFPIGLIAGLVVACGYGSAHLQAHPPWSSLPSTPLKVLYAPDDPVKATILNAVNATAETLDLALYGLSEPTVIAKLKERAESGVAIRLLLNKAGRCGSRCDELEASGIDVRYVSPTMHHKFAIADGNADRNGGFDDATLLTGSGNWSTVGTTRYDEDLLVFKGDSPVVRAFQAEFNHLWEHSRDFPGPARSASTVAVQVAAANAYFTSANFQPFRHGGQWSFRRVGEGAVSNRLVEAIASARERIRIATTHLRLDAIYIALRNAMERGVQVELITDGQEYSGGPYDPDSAMHFDELLAEFGATVRYKVNAPYWSLTHALQMHTKYMIVDERLVLTGSYNWSHTAETKTMENLIALDAPAVVSAYIDHFSKLMRYGDGDLPDLHAAIRGRDGRGPCIFKPIALTREEYAHLRSLYRAGACRFLLEKGVLSTAG